MSDRSGIDWSFLKRAHRLSYKATALMYVVMIMTVYGSYPLPVDPTIYDTPAAYCMLPEFVAHRDPATHPLEIPYPEEDLPAQPPRDSNHNWR